MSLHVETWACFMQLRPVIALQHCLTDISLLVSPVTMNSENFLSVSSVLFYICWLSFLSWFLTFLPRCTKYLCVLCRPWKWQNVVICLLTICFSQVSVKMVGDSQCLPDVQQAHLSPPSWAPTSIWATTESPGGLRGEHMSSSTSCSPINCSFN